jgi:hypothetical protein
MAKKGQRKCGFCNKWFDPIHTGQRYCLVSHKRAAKAQRDKMKRMPVERKCMLCGAVYLPTKANQLYCSVTHGDAYRKARSMNKKVRQKSDGRKCSCGCGRPVGRGKRFLSDICYQNHDDVAIRL